MPLAPLAAAILSAGSSIATGVGNYQGTRKQQHRAHRLNLDAWNRQNEYNHPLAQMQRLREAGLNPNMIYGSSPTSATGQAGQIAPVKATDVRFENPLVGLQLHSDIKQRQAQTNNLRVQNDVLEQEAIIKALEAGIKSNTLKSTSAKASVSQDLANSSVDAARENVKNIQLRNQNQEVQNTIQDSTKLAQISRIRTEAKKAVQDLSGQKLLNRLRHLEVQLKEMGIERTDNMIFRMLGRSWNALSPELKRRFRQYKGTTNNLKH